MKYSRLMIPDNAVKTSQINLRVSDSEKKSIQTLADFFTAGDVSTLQRQLFIAAEKSLEKHGSRTKWPPELNHYAPSARTGQDIETGLNLEKETGE